ncbi:HK97 gp10 family phage protein [Fusobacterium mortiferum]|uniref:HK97 gp10 family phage protein n=1 Tax=Fusobacterium mortiferum TaxID=850 RepID=A0ABS2FZU6_FUSMR|nr:HK97 gp10 family phage protein [Fusobacterium mortiferum]MBM6874681.1 HK97 gp10 family phage protein [Fusobacterium mortiferum]
MSDFDNYEKSLLKLNEALTNTEARKFLKKQGKALQKKTLEVAQRKTKKRTGNYIRGIKAGKVYKFDGAFACRVYSKAPHAHLIEYGHKIVTKNGEVKGYQRGLNVFDDAKKAFEDEFTEALENYVDEVCKKNGF